MTGKKTSEICVIAPIVPTDARPDTAGVYEQAAPAGFQVRVVCLDRGPASIESEYEESLAVPDVLCKARQAEAQGCDAIVISCMLDPGLAAAREAVSVPVLGPAQVAMHVAALLGACFSIVTVTDSLLAPLRRRAVLYGLEDRLASVRSIQLPVLELKDHRQQVLERLTDQSCQAVRSDGASVVVLGCTGMAGMARAIQLELRRQNCEVPVIDPSVTAIQVAASLVNAGLTHSPIAFLQSPAKAVTGYEWL
jgi:allantoin racemase